MYYLDEAAPSFSEKPAYSQPSNWLKLKISHWKIFPYLSKGECSVLKDLMKYKDNIGWRRLLERMQSAIDFLGSVLKWYLEWYLK